MIPELRTTPRLAIFLALASVLAIVVAVTLGSQVEDALGSSAAALLLLSLWCAVGVGAAMAAIVDAYVQPEGELLGLITTIAATVFAVLSMLVVAAIAVGATNVPELAPPKDPALQPG